MGGGEFEERGSSHSREVMDSFDIIIERQCEEDLGPPKPLPCLQAGESTPLWAITLHCVLSSGKDLTPDLKQPWHIPCRSWTNWESSLFKDLQPLR